MVRDEKKFGNYWTIARVTIDLEPKIRTAGENSISSYPKCNRFREIVSVCTTDVRSCTVFAYSSPGTHRFSGV